MNNIKNRNNINNIYYIYNRKTPSLLLALAQDLVGIKKKLNRTRSPPASFVNNALTRNMV